MPISASEEPFFRLGQRISASEIHVFCLGLSFSAPLEHSFLAIVVIVHVVFSRFLYIIYIYAREIDVLILSDYHQVQLEGFPLVLSVVAYC